MNTQLADILQLPVKERIRLVEDIWDSIASAPEALELTDEQASEIENRLQSFRTDPDKVSSWKDVRQRLSKRNGPKG